MYPPEDTGSGVSTMIRTDEFYGKKLATAIREVLDKRKAAGRGASTPKEIYDDLVRGGFHFQTKNEDNAMRGVYQALTKNAVTFHRLPNDTYGLLAWYPEATRRRQKAKCAEGANGSDAEEGDDEETPLHEELQSEVSGSDEMPAPKAK